MPDLPLVYIDPSRTGRFNVYISTNGFQAWGAAQGLLTLDAASEVALLVGRHTLAALLADIDAKIANPTGQWGWDDDHTPEIKARIIEGWKEEREALIARMPRSYEEIVVRP